mgnify:CR=1 FL=1
MKEAKRQKEYYRQAEENAVSEEEKMNFISEIKLNLANRKKKKDAKRKYRYFTKNPVMCMIVIYSAHTHANKTATH